MKYSTGFFETEIFTCKTYEDLFPDILTAYADEQTLTFIGESDSVDHWFTISRADAERLRDSITAWLDTTPEDAVE